ncbi:hypothetical protein [Saccharopolyspora gloriosae]|uniref:hypothetical protein n=1 Tax=Saccharopolyspora gloriosae TaxID=455344 RepID=UPI001FB811E3|nr:hypothetical protein [Saccharopolyspora gloriosae]
MSAIEHQGPPDSQFWMRGERPSAPVLPDPESGSWNVYGHAEALEVLGDPATYSSNTTRLYPRMREFVVGDPVQLDPPEHTKLRKIVAPGRKIAITGTNPSQDARRKGACRVSRASLA